MEKAKLTADARRRAMRAMYVAATLGDTGMFMYLSLMVYVFRETFAVNLQTFGYIQSICAFVQMVCSPLLGRMADLYSAKAVLLLCAVSGATAHFLMGIANGMTVLLISRATSIFMAFGPGCQMLISSILDGPERTAALGRAGLPTSFGLIFGPLISGLLSSQLGQQSTCLVVWTLFALAGLLVLTSIPAVRAAKKNETTANGDEQKEETGKRQVLKLCFTGKIPYLLLIHTFIALPTMMIQISFPVITMDTFGLNQRQNGFVGSFLGITLTIVNGFVVGRLSKAYDRSTLIKWSAVLGAIAYALMAQCSNIWMFCGVLVPWITSFGILSSVVVSMATSTVPQSHTGTIVGVTTGAFHLARTVSPIIGAHLVQHTGLPGVAYAGLLSSLFVCGICFLQL